MIRNILIICTGNICRSPIGEGLLRSRLAGVEVASAGTALGTPWAENTTGAPVAGISSSSSTKMAPRDSRLATTCLLCTICLRT